MSTYVSPLLPNTYSVSTLKWVGIMVRPLTLPFSVSTPGIWAQHMGAVCLRAVHSCAGAAGNNLT